MKRLIVSAPSDITLDALTPEQQAALQSVIAQWVQPMPGTIEHDGTILETRPLDYQGAGCSGQNAHTAHISYFGGLEDDTLRSKDTRTDAQKDATVWLIRKLAEDHPELDHKRDVVGHNMFAAKDCPCFNVNDWVDAVIREDEQGGVDPEPGMPEIENLIQYVRDLESRIAKLEAHNTSWGPGE